MKITKGRGIQFFKKPFFEGPAKHVGRIYKAGHKQLTSAIKFVGGKVRKEHK